MGGDEMMSVLAYFESNGFVAHVLAGVFALGIGVGLKAIWVKHVYPRLHHER